MKVSDEDKGEWVRLCNREQRYQKEYEDAFFKWQDAKKKKEEFKDKLEEKNA